MAHVPDVILNQLRCVRCRSYLSCGPIAILSNGESLCGRCTIPGSNIFRAYAYEAVAMYFLFPCKYWTKHCAYYLNFNEVMEHEAKCVFKSTCSVLCSNPGALFKPENKLDLTQPIKVFTVPEQVLEILTCSTCEYYLSSSPIFVNNDGRSSCHRCHEAKRQVPNGYIQQAALEKILEIMLFPCMFRHRGCTQYFRFGINTTAHEEECSYGKVQRRPTQTFVDGKAKGVIVTHTGHTYGTITPYTHMFVPQGKRVSQGNGNVEPVKMQPSEVQDAFFNQLKKHRQNLEYKWKSKQEQTDLVATNYNQQQPTDSTANNQMARNDSQNLVFRYPEYQQNPGQGSNGGGLSYLQPGRYLQTQTSTGDSQKSAESPFGKQPGPNPKLSQSHSYRSDSQNSANSSMDSGNGYPQQLIVPRPTQPQQHDIVYANSFTYFDRFDRPIHPQRSESLLYNGGIQSKAQRTDSVGRKSDYDAGNGNALSVQPAEAPRGGSFRY